MSNGEYLASEIVSFLVSEEMGDAKALRDTIKYYSNMDVIPVKAILKTGRGTPRLYDRDGFLTACITVRLNQLGIPIGQLKLILGDLRSSIKPRKGLHAAARAIDKDVENVCVMILLPPLAEELKYCARLTSLKQAYDWVFQQDEDILIIRLGRYLSYL